MSEIDSKQLANLDPAAREELAKFIEQESSKSKLQNGIHTFTDLCFKKCVKSDITYGTVDSQEAAYTNIKIVEFITNATKQ
ncbi:hypothetical protein V1511DRAFT_510661 [Dipodascopsis uninucleata]